MGAGGNRIIPVDDRVVARLGMRRLEMISAKNGYEITLLYNSTQCTHQFQLSLRKLVSVGTMYRIITMSNDDWAQSGATELVEGAS